ncbi:MAG TPA: biotin/lipoyl-containing protein, partial [Opitutales bacterium]|nr:biotin/lipoyl-containing protein [Opitutales bacterium]
MEVKLPSLGEGAATGTVVNILVKEGDTVEKDQALMEIESDKAVAELPAPEAGTVDSIRVSKDDEVSEGDVLVILSEAEGGGEAEEEGGGEAGEEKEGKTKTKEKDQEEKKEDEKEDGEETDQDEVDEAKKAEAEADQEPEAKRGQRAPAAPSIRRMAAELGIDLDRVGGSGRGGRIEVEDLRAYIAQLEKRVERGAKDDRKEANGLPEMPDAADYGAVDTESLTGIRKTIARRLARTWPNVPQVTQFGEADLAQLMRLKEEHDDAFEKKDTKLTLTAILVAM